MNVMRSLEVRHESLVTILQQSISFSMQNLFRLLPQDFGIVGQNYYKGISSWHHFTMQQGLPFEKKNCHEIFNFENWFLCQFSSNTRFSFGRGSLNTPKIEKREKEFTNINLRGFKTQKTWRGCFSRIKRVSKFSFLYMLWYLLS